MWNKGQAVVVGFAWLPVVCGGQHPLVLSIFKMDHESNDLLLDLFCNFVTLFDLPQNTNNNKTRQLHKSK